MTITEYFIERALLAVHEWDGLHTGELFAAIIERSGETPRQALFADGREPTQNERHLLTLLSWRERETGTLKEQIRELQETINGLCDRVAAQADLLARNAERKGGQPR